MIPLQRTLKARASMHGIGLHTGEECRIDLLPADAGTGVVFVVGNDEVRALASNVKDTNRGTTIQCGSADIHTVEHLLAALAGMWVDNVLIRVEGPEIPAADGSALPFAQLIVEAGIMEQDARAEIVELPEPVWVLDGAKCLIADPDSRFRVTELISFSHPMIGEQALSLTIDPETFMAEIAPARTFCTSDEIEMIRAAGLGKGGSENNVIVAYEDHYSTQLRFENEFVRHKTLDLIGDLSLMGRRVNANITALRSSHALNISLAKKIMSL